ncbi:MAG: methenyltetrahydrofolate cyclohydrolase [bacterium (Candidatus Ratteibacteria) CG_4_10_14_3_um_filter_41_18]|uniref:Methenyltetrahydrofolate cyclohydrolase n=4 Tax=Candidatus Ratteibacteria TaxID=2979319 RepID=A0A2M7YHC1_9BACT|nr:MAG: hypothetical protein AUJ76_01015 [Candidatus Omnitrophica bacterium CG1_02_41_171]PIV64731.1 MAG: methenyltetrahydrofolate cyclohydrolase [bacterium (Candidatus Ratteibacteria) CG01_land_8_20_14_3_00_40_19]PIW34197.1 MAG: methenyltetrahydrofolate cyclohydrolase [bacterium (Candidatus Ratteibacteria) CG15_BIG_FIL_POST_REV_8_21_14_020_41_12]PIW73740.1 MAG: methenyltetrahydrofolate cyclohydrolase [bacterium (Candidatus Ratteibacteria) CG_4_8_14_3_um_filter_41_36]PIX76628.1 MAG: methenyltet
MWREKSLNNYLDKLASRSPVPGGGSAAALLGALAAALASMTANFTLGKPKYKKVEKSITKILKKAENLRERLSQLAEEDSIVYTEVSQAYRLRPEGKERDKVVSKALRQASKVPFEVVGLSFQLLKLNEELASKGNRNLISDVGVSVIFSLAALETAILNVEINLSGIKDKEFITGKRNTLKLFLKEGKKIEEKVVKKVEKLMKK